MSSTRQGRLIGSGMVNFRDLGGLPAGADARTAHGVLYRGDTPHHGDTPPPGVAGWPPVLVLDLRESTESAGRHPLAGTGTDVVRVPLLAGPHVADWRTLSSLDELYLGSLSRASERISEVLGLLNSAAGPTLVHCAAGKDRTGVLVAVLLRAAGVPREAVLEDYLRTEQNVPALLEQLARDLSLLNEEDRLQAQHLAGTSASALRSVLDELDTASGGVSGWLQAGGVSDSTLRTWRRRLVVPSSSGE